MSSEAEDEVERIKSIVKDKFAETEMGRVQWTLHGSSVVDNIVRAVLAAQAPQWKGIDDHAKDGRMVDLFGPLGRGYRRVTDCYWHKKARTWHTKNYDKDGYSHLRLPFQPTHYMDLLPAPPTAEAEHGGT